MRVEKAQKLLVLSDGHLTVTRSPFPLIPRVARVPDPTSVHFSAHGKFQYLFSCKDRYLFPCSGNGRVEKLP